MANGRTQTPPKIPAPGTGPGGLAPAVPAAPVQSDPRFETMSGIPLKPVYTEADRRPDLQERLGEPGQFP